MKSITCEFDKIDLSTPLCDYEECFALYYILSGDAEVYIDDEFFAGEENMLFFRKPNNILKIQESGARILRVKFSGKIAQECHIAPLVQDPDSGMFYISGEDVAVFNTFFSEMAENSADSGYLKLLVNCVLAKLAQSCEEYDINKISKRAVLFAAENFRGEVSLETVSTNAELAPTYFSEVFKKETGQNFKKYLTEIRLNFAKNLLVSTNLPPAEICAKSGFGDFANFIRSFGRAYGMPPGEYRKKCK